VSSFAVQPPRAAIAAAEALINRLLALDPDHARGLGRLAGRVIELRISAPPLHLFVLPESRGVALHQHCDTPSDVVLTGSALGFLRLSRAGADPARFAAQGVAIEGSTEVAQDMKRLLDTLDIDWEEWLSGYVGDVAAHALGNLVRTLAAFGRRSADTLGRDAAEYLQEEARVLAPRHRVESFLHEVDVLRADLDRLERRVQRAGARRA
jgi:ubiquinone biosynthesis protein UbiJ